ncbi:MAG TPA: hypothetical protein V6C93_12250, partial [Allocoleopsis sp.]
MPLHRLAMSGFEPSNAPKDHLSEVALEPVHFASSIQPYGVLFALSDPELIILQVSANTQDYLGISAQHLLGQPLGVLLNAASLEVIQQALENFGRFSKSSLRVCRGEKTFNGTLYRTAATIILELELASSPPEACHVQMHTLVKQ